MRTAGAEQRAHTLSHRHEAERAKAGMVCGFETSKPTPSDIVTPAKSHLLSLHRQRHLLGPNIQTPVSVGMLSFRPATEGSSLVARIVLHTYKAAELHKPFTFSVSGFQR